MNKKAIQELALEILIGAVVFIIVLGISTQANAELAKKQTKEICRASIIKVETFKEAASGIAKSAINCPMQYVTVKKKDNENAAKRKIANIMEDAWAVTNKGESRTFQERLWQGGTVHCLLYARIDFEKNFPLAKSNFEQFSSWLTANEPIGSPTSYFEYMSYNGKRAFAIIGGDEQNLESVDYIDPSKSYYVIYWASMKDEDIIRVANLRENLNDLITLIQSEDNKKIPVIMAVPENLIGSVGCDSFLN